MINHIRWMIVSSIRDLSLVGKETVSLPCDMHILFYNLHTCTQTTYTADDGVECFVGHNTAPMFAFAERRDRPRIFLMTYPDFRIVAAFEDDESRQYAALELTEYEHVIALSNAPSCRIIVWCWRNEQKLIAYQTDIQHTHHIIRSNIAQNNFFYYSTELLCVWDIVPTHKACMLFSKPLPKEKVDFVDFVWTNDGNLYGIDRGVHLYSIVSEGLHLMTLKEWTSTASSEVPLITQYRNGLIIYGPNNTVQCIKKSSKDWTVSWEYVPEDVIVRLVSSYVKDILICATARGDIFKLSYENQTVTCAPLMFMENQIERFDIINPNGDGVITLSSSSSLCLWENSTGKMKSRINMRDEASNIASNPVNSSFAVTCGHDKKYGVYLMKINKDRLECVSFKCLTDSAVDQILWYDKGNGLLVHNKIELFCLKISDSLEIEVVYYLKVENDIQTSFIMNSDNCNFLLCYTKDNEAKSIRIFDVCKKEELLTLEIMENYEKLIMNVGENILIGTFEGNTEFDILNLKFESDNVVALEKIKSLDINRKASHCCHIMDGDIITWTNIKVELYSLHPHLSLVVEVILCHQFGDCLNTSMIYKRYNCAIALTSACNLIVYYYTDLTTKQTEKKKIHYNADAEIIYDLDSYFDEKTKIWVEEEKKMMELKEFNDLKGTQQYIAEKYAALQHSLSKVIDENESSSPAHRLPLDTFRLNFCSDQIIFADAEAERTNEKLEIENRIALQEDICAWIKTHCWHPMETIGTEVHSILTDEYLENYPLPKRAVEDKSKLQMLKMLEEVSSSDLLTEWKNLSRIKCRDDVNVKHSNDALNEIFSQTMLQSFLQTDWWSTLIQESTLETQMNFNESFNVLTSEKKRQIELAMARIDRLKFIVSELNQLRKLIGCDEKVKIILQELALVQEEIPLKLIEVKDDEINVSPYSSPCQKKKDISSLHVDNKFYDDTLINLMDGTLEKQWYIEVKRSVPKPACMIEKDEDELVEADLLEIEEWRTKTKEREVERIVYGNQLYDEFFTITKEFKESLRNFHEQYKAAFVEKLKVDFTIAQQELKLMLLRLNNTQRIDAINKLMDTESELAQVESELENTVAEINEINSQLTECHAYCETLMARERMLDKNFKSNFSDMPPIALDMCYKAFKKRPKWQTKQSMTANVLVEMAQTCLTKERPPFLHADCNDYLSGIDQLDTISNMPPVLDEQTWISVCKLRRIKIENEIKIHATVAETTDVEAALATWQKRFSLLKVQHQKLKNDLSNRRSFMELQARNKMFPLVVKSGLVEIDITGHLSDFKDAILIKQEEVVFINDQIKKASQTKDKAENATIGFKKYIIAKEWEHATLKMKVEQLKKELYYFERIKITKEIKSYIHNKTNYTFNKHDIEKKLKVTKSKFEKQLLDQMQRNDELEMKISSINNQIKSTDVLITKLKDDILKFYKDPKREKEKLMESEKKMNTLVWRNRLVSEVQQQHCAIMLLQTELELQRLKTYPTLNVPQHQ